MGYEGSGGLGAKKIKKRAAAASTGAADDQKNTTNQSAAQPSSSANEGGETTIKKITNSNHSLDDEGKQKISDETSESSSISATQQTSHRKSSKVWRVAVTSVDVLGTSIRHLLVSIYDIASSVATLGRKRQVGNLGKNEVDDASKSRSNNDINNSDDSGNN